MLNTNVSDQLIDDLHRLGRVMRSSLFAAQRSALTPQQFWLLRVLAKHHPTSVGAIADELGITASSATSACKRLEQAGLVTRTRQPRDERVVWVDLTPEGLAQLQEMHLQHRRALTDLLAILNPEEQKNLHGILQRLLSTLHVDDVEAHLLACAHGEHGGQGDNRREQIGTND